MSASVKQHVTLNSFVRSSDFFNPIFIPTDLKLYIWEELILEFTDIFESNEGGGAKSIVD